MDEASDLCDALLTKIHEQMDGVAHLTALLPPNRLDWTPVAEGAWTARVLLGHLLDCISGFCAVLVAFEPERLAHFAALRNLPVNHRCTADEAAVRLAIYRAHIDEGFLLLRDADLARRIPTVFVKQGEPLLTLLLGNLEHLINHKHQLFTYLQAMGVAVSSKDLYRFRE